MMSKDIHCIIGPTGIGKTAYAIKLAKQINAEIISADAYQVYRQMDIGTAKPSLDELNLIPHHLIDIKHPSEPYSLHEFLSLTETLISDLRKKNKSIIICGGTALFIHAFIYSYSLPKAASDSVIRDQLIKDYDVIGKDALWKKLHSIDPTSAQSIHPNNKHHLIRALEIYYISNKKPSEEKQKSNTIREDVKIIGLTSSKDVVHERIEQRVDMMMANGFIEEVQTLIHDGITPSMQSFKALGYLQVLDYINGLHNKEDMVEDIKKLTKKFSKRQMTWFKRIEDASWKTI